DLLEEILEAAVVGFEDRVLRREIDRVVAQQPVVEAGPREAADRLVDVVHRQRDAAAFVLIHLALDRGAAVGRRERHGQRPGAGDDEVGRAILVAEGVTADHDRLRPAGHEPRNVAADDRLAEDRAVEFVADRAVRRLPHLLQSELLDARLVRRDRRAFHADAVLLDRARRVERHPIVGRVPVLDPQIVVLQVDVEIRQDQLVLDELPDDARHLVAVELDDGVLDLDLFQRCLRVGWAYGGQFARGARCPRPRPPASSGRSGGRPAGTRAGGAKARFMRVVSLLPSSTEILFAIGAGDTVVGVTHECDFPAAARTRPVLTSSLLPHELDAAGIDRHVRARVHAGSSLYGLDDAKLAALEPDLIVTQELCAVCAVSYEIVDRAAKRLRGDPRVVSLEPSSLDDVFGTIRFLGELTGARAGAADLVARLTARADALRARVAARPRERVLVLEWTDPPMSAGHWTPGLVELAGGEPVVASPGVNSRVLGWDEIARADPDVVIVAPCGFGLERAAREVAALPPEAARAFGALRAVREERAFAMDGNAYVNRPGPRLVDSAEIFARAVSGGGAELERLRAA